MTCSTQPCPNFAKRMAAERKAGEFREALTQEQRHTERLRQRLARVGVRDVDAEEQADTRPSCAGRTWLGPCGERALFEGLCAGHAWDAMNGELP